jgi:hypothetical protein
MRCAQERHNSRIVTAIHADAVQLRGNGHGAAVEEETVAICSYCLVRRCPLVTSSIDTNRRICSVYVEPSLVLATAEPTSSVASAPATSGSFDPLLTRLSLYIELASNVKRNAAESGPVSDVATATHRAFTAAQPASSRQRIARESRPVIHVSVYLDTL